MIDINPEETVILHNIYGPNSHAKSKVFFAELKNRVKEAKDICTLQSITIIAGDFNATIEEGDSIFYNSTIPIQSSSSNQDLIIFSPLVTKDSPITNRVEIPNRQPHITINP